MENYLNSQGFRMATDEEHNKIINSERKIVTFRVTCMSAFLLLTIISTLLMVRKVDKVVDSASEDLSAGFNVTEERIIQELYGDPESYADSMLYKNKSTFLDKAATAATGEMTYDEVAMENYRNQMINEFNSKIDHKKVAEELAKEKEAYIAGRKADVEKAKESNCEHKNKLMLLILAGVALITVTGYFFWIKRYMLVKGRNYTVAIGRIAAKNFSNRSDVLIAVRRRATVAYHGGSAEAIMTYGQCFSIPEGDDVYLVHTNRKVKPYLICKM